MSPVPQTMKAVSHPSIISMPGRLAGSVVAGVASLAMVAMALVTGPAAHAADAPRDVARDGTAVASSEFPLPQFGVQHVNDGDPTTRWATDYTHPAGPGYPASDHDPSNDWVYIKLAEPSPVYKVVLDWEAAFGSRYAIQTSTDGTTWDTVHTVTDGHVGRTELVLGVTQPVRYVKMQGIATAWGLYSLFSFEIWNTASPADEVPPDPSDWAYGTDIARDGTATAKSVYTGNTALFAAEHVNDGNSSTRWASDYPRDGVLEPPPSTYDPTNDWIQIKLAEPSPIWSVVLNWETARPSQYELQTSVDGTNWTTLRTVNDPSTGDDEQILGIVDPVQYVRMQGVARATGWGYSLWAFEVWSGPKAPPAPGGTIVPAPVSQTELEASDFTLTPGSRIMVNDDAALPVAELLAGDLRPATGFDLPVTTGDATAADVSLVLADAEAPGTSDLATQEGYTLRASSDGVRIGAATAHGLFNGTQTLLQLLPPEVTGDVLRPGPWQIDATMIVDYPRFGYRGLMIDPARNFIAVDGVKSIIDTLAAMKGNRLHIHLSDDQGWRIEIKSWPRLTEVGGAMSMPGGISGFYTQAQFADIVAYANARFVEVIPEIEMPGHAGAAIASYPELACGSANTFCPTSATVDGFLNDVIGEIAPLTNSDLFHIGGDESISGQPYVDFIKKVEGFVMDHGKRMVGWSPVMAAGLDPSSVHQYWRDQSGEMTPDWFNNTNQVILSPTSKVYLDYPYPGNNAVSTYDWDPSSVFDDYRNATLQSFGLRDENIIGIEGAAWGEQNTYGLTDVEYKVFPREASILDLAWSPKERTADPASFVQRLAVQGSRWQFAGTNFWSDTTVDWTTSVAGTVHEPTAEHPGVDGTLATIASPTIGVGALSASIDWGDGATSEGVVTGTTASGWHGNSLYQVSGEHSYADPVEHTGTVTVTSLGGGVWTATFVVRAPEPQPQTITFDSLADAVVGQADISLHATASSGLPVAFTATGACTVSGTTLQVTGVGVCTVTAAQPGNAYFAAAADVVRSFSVAYAVAGLPDLSKPVQVNATLPLVLMITDAAGTNLSSATITVHAIGIDGTDIAPAPGNSQPGQDFRFDTTLSRYQYNVQTTGMSVGEHTLSYSIAGDPTTHSVTFTVVD